MSSRLACPPDRSVDIALRRSASPNTSSSWLARRDASRKVRPKNRLRNSRFSATVSCMSSVLFWVTTPILRFTPTGSATTSRPATQARPPVGRTRVVSMPMVVDLPAPFGPSSPKNWPEPTDRSMPRTAGTSPRDDLYVLRKSSVCIASPAAPVMMSPS